MKVVALLGAGFSRNWGGWLANEAFEYLIGAPTLRRRPEITRLLWKHQSRGGFEGALEELQVEYSRSKDASSLAQLRLLNDAVRQMFADMNAAFFGPKFEFNDDARLFLSRFDAIFTLNQDLLLERHYIHSGQFPPRGGPKKWSGATLPGITSPFTNFDGDVARWQNERWRVVPGAPQLGTKPQPIFKLHGSSQWYRDNDQDGLIVIGGGKSKAIEQDELLGWYWQQFRHTLTQTGTRLMIIGYGFLDAHVNQVIRDAGTNGTKMFVVDPWGADVWVDGRDSPVRGTNHLQSFLIGASRRGMREIMDQNTVEHSKVMRFFADD